MKQFLLLLILYTSTLFAQKAPFASQSDLVADLSDSILNDIYFHRLNVKRCPGENRFWIDGFGNYRHRKDRSNRSNYEDRFGGVLLGLNSSLSSKNSLNIFVGASYGNIAIENERDFHTYSVLWGSSFEHLCAHQFFGFAFVAGFLDEERYYQDIHEKPRGILLSPEFCYSYLFNLGCLYPTFTANVRYAGFFSRDYQHRELLGTLYVRDRTIQLITLRSELGSVIPLKYLPIETYIGVAGRFQFDGNTVEGKLFLDNQKFSDGIDSSIAYGLVGFRYIKRLRCFEFLANAEGSYDSDLSWRVLGKINLNYRY